MSIFFNQFLVKGRIETNNDCVRSWCFSTSMSWDCFPMSPWGRQAGTKHLRVSGAFHRLINKQHVWGNLCWHGNECATLSCWEWYCPNSGFEMDPFSNLACLCSCWFCSAGGRVPVGWETDWQEHTQWGGKLACSSLVQDALIILVMFFDIPPHC